MGWGLAQPRHRPRKGLGSPRYSGEGFSWIYPEDNPSPTKSMTFPPDGDGLCPAHQSPDWFPQLGLLGAVMRRLCPMPRSKARSWERKRRIPNTNPGHEDPGSLHRGTDWRDLNWDCSRAPTVPTEAKHFRGFCPCTSRQSRSWVETPTFRALPTLSCPCGDTGMGKHPQEQLHTASHIPRKLCPGRTTSELQIQSRQTLNSKFPESGQPPISKLGEN